MAETNLRQAKAKMTCIGLVSEKDLKNVTEEGKTRIEGHVTIKTSDTNFIKFNVRVNEKTNAGAENKAFDGIKTVMEEYKSIAEFGEDGADKVRVTGDLNIFTGQNGTSVGYKGSFFRRLRVDEVYEPKAEFEVEMFISSITPEIDTEGSETGRVIVNGYVPTYNGIEPLKLIAEEDVASAVDSMFEPGMTVEFYGDAVNSKIEKIIEIPVVIGKPRREVKTTYKNELVINGASAPYEEGVTAEKPYDSEVIKAALQERQNKLEEAKAKAQNAAKPATTARPSGARSGRTLGF